MSERHSPDRDGENAGYGSADDQPAKPSVIFVAEDGSRWLQPTVGPPTRISGPTHSIAPSQPAAEPQSTSTTFDMSRTADATATWPGEPRENGVKTFPPKSD